MTLISEADADSRQVAVMVSFEYASSTDNAVMATWRLILLTCLAVPPRYQRVVDNFVEVICATFIDLCIFMLFEISADTVLYRYTFSYRWQEYADVLPVSSYKQMKCLQPMATLS